MPLVILNDSDNVRRFFGSTDPYTILGLGGDDELVGGDANDVIEGGSGNDVVGGGPGVDLLFGGDGDDNLVSREGDDYLFGGAGNDSLFAIGAGTDTFFGGTGDDSFGFSDLEDQFGIFYGDAGDDHFDVFSNADNFQLFGGSGNDRFEYFEDIGGVFGGSGHDTYDLASFQLDQRIFINRYEGSDLTVSRNILAGEVLDSIEEILLPERAASRPFVFMEGERDAQVLVRGGGAGSEVFLDASFASFIGGSGIDTVVVYAGNSYAGLTITGGAGDSDKLRVLDGVDLRGTTLSGFEQLQILGVAQQATIHLLGSQVAQFTDGFVNGTSASADKARLINVTMDMQTTVDLSGLGSGQLRGNLTFNVMGDGQAETVKGSILDDTIVGKAGNDTLSGSKGADGIIGGRGADKIAGGRGLDRLSGDKGDDRLEGNAGADLLTGGKGADRLFGGSGADVLNGGNGKDVLKGGTGADKITGGKGLDKMTGGGGKDSFVFTKATDSGKGTNKRDVIKDFGGKDVVDLSELDANLRRSGSQDFDYIGKSGFSGDGAEVRWTKAGKDVVVKIDLDGTKNGAEMEVLLKGASALNAADFIL